MDGKRMHMRLELIGQHGIDHPVTFDPRFAAKSGGHDSDTEMAFTLGMRAGMSGMQMRFIDELERGR